MSDDKYQIRRPTGVFRRYIEVDGRWRHVYVVATFYQKNIFGEDVKMVEFTLTKGSKTTHAAERKYFHEEKPRKRKNVEGLA